MGSLARVANESCLQSGPDGHDLKYMSNKVAVLNGRRLPISRNEEGASWLPHFLSSIRQFLLRFRHGTLHETLHVS